MDEARRQFSVRLGALVAIMVIAFLLVGGRAEAGAPQAEPGVHTVRAGDTLWGIASSVAGPEHDLRRVVSEIRRLNGMEDATIHPGQVIRVPDLG